jgi:hypothetical protein
VSSLRPGINAKTQGSKGAEVVEEALAARKRRRRSLASQEPNAESTADYTDYFLFIRVIREIRG